jgi:hypothetical protein
MAEMKLRRQEYKLILIWDLLGPGTMLFTPAPENFLVSENSPKTCAHCQSLILMKSSDP